jgi:hypothetical protein
MAAFKAATGWNAGSDAGEWKRMWKEKEAYWEYHPHQPPPEHPAQAPWVSQLPPAVLQQTSGPAPTAIPPPEP